MLPTTPLLFLAGAATIVLSLPVSEKPGKRYCAPALLPSTIVQLHENDPDSSYTNTAHTNYMVYISQDVNSSDQVNKLIAFTVPADSWGCQLGITFPSNYVFLNSTDAASTLNVYSVSTPLPSNPTWNNIQTGYLFGTVTPVIGQGAIVNSEACPTTAAFDFEYTNSQAGSIG